MTHLRHRFDVRGLRSQGPYLVASVVAVVLAGCAHQAIPGGAERSRTADAIQRDLPLFAALRVTWWEHRTDCQRFEYGRGAFVRGDPTSVCWNLGPAVALDRQATSDLKGVEDALERDGVARSAQFQFSSDGRITYATFEAGGGPFDRFTYFFQDDGAVPDGIDANPDEVFQINPHWWFANTDWN